MAKKPSSDFDDDGGQEMCHCWKFPFIALEKMIVFYFCFKFLVMGGIKQEQGWKKTQDVCCLFIYTYIICLYVLEKKGK